MAEGGRYEIRDGEKVLIERTGHTPKPLEQPEEVSREDTEEVHTGED